MARVTLEGCVSAQKRKTVLVLTNRMQRDVPAVYGMTLLALRSHLAAVNVGVTIGALVSHIGKNQACVALGTRNILMESAQWVTGLIVIKFGNITDWFPSRERMAVLARDVQRPVRAVRSSPLICRLHEWRAQQEKGSD